MNFFGVVFSVPHNKILARKESVSKSTFQLKPIESSQRMSHTDGFPVRARRQG